MAFDTRLIEITQELQSYEFEDVLIFVRSNAPNRFKIMGTESMVKGFKCHLAEVIGSEAIQSLNGIGKDIFTSLHGPPALPEPPNCMDLASLIHYCDALVQFESEINPQNAGWPGWYKLPTKDVERSGLLEVHYRSLIAAFFAHHSLDLKKHVVFATEAVELKTCGKPYYDESAVQQNPGGHGFDPQAIDGVEELFSGPIFTADRNESSENLDNIDQFSNKSSDEDFAPASSVSSADCMSMDCHRGMDNEIKTPAKLKTCSVSLSRVDTCSTTLLPAKRTATSSDEMIRKKRPKFDSGPWLDNEERFEVGNRPFKDWPSLPCEIPMLQKVETVPYIYTVLSHLIQTSFNMQCSSRVINAAKEYLPDWVTDPKDIAGYSVDVQRKIIAYLIENFAAGKVQIDPLALDFQRVEAFLPKDAELKLIRGDYLDRFLEYYGNTKSFIPNLFSCSNVDPDQVRAFEFLDYSCFVRWSLKSIVGREGDKFLRSVDNAKATIGLKEIRRKVNATRQLQCIADVLNMDRSDDTSRQREMVALSILYRYRLVAAKIGHVGWTGNDVSEKLGGTKRAPNVDWPKLYRPVEKMNPQEVRSYLLRAFLFLDQRRDGWRMDVLGPNFASQCDPYDNDAATNQRILKQLLATRGSSFVDEDLLKALWPPLPRKLEEMNFVETVIYAQLLVLHLSGYKPNLADPNDRPCYWGRVWGLPLNTSSAEEWNAEWHRILGEEANESDHVARWTRAQKTSIAQVADCYANPAWREPDKPRYVTRVEQNFPYLGRLNLYDYIALNRFRTYAEIYSPNKERVRQKSVIVDLFSRFPCLPITPVDLSLSIPDIRGFVLELAIHLLGHRPAWRDDSEERPEFWPESLPWAHPFSSAFSSTEILDLFVELLVKFAPKNLNVLPRIVDGKDLGYEGVNISWTGWNGFDAKSPHVPSTHKQEVSRLCEFERLRIKRDALALAMQQRAKIVEAFAEDGREKKTKRSLKLPKGVVERFSKKSRENNVRDSELGAAPKNRFEIVNVDTMNSQEMREYSRVLQNCDFGERIGKRADAMEDSELREFLTNFTQFGSTVSLTPTHDKILWPPFPCPDWIAGKKFNPDYLVCLTRALLKNAAPDYNNPQSKPSFWPSWAKWVPARNLSPTNARRIVVELLKKFCVDIDSVPVCEFEFECMRNDFVLHQYLKDHLKIPKSVNSVKTILSLYQTKSYLLCLSPELTRPLHAFNREDAKFFMNSLYYHFATLFGEAIIAPFKDSMHAPMYGKFTSSDNSQDVIKHAEFFDLNPPVSEETAAVGHALRRISKVAKKMGHLPKTSLPRVEVSSCPQWPLLPNGSLESLEDFELANYLTRLISFLSDADPTWSTPSPISQWPHWAPWRDPRQNDGENNKKIIRHLMLEFGVLQLPCRVKKFWPPLPKPLERLTFPDVAGYIMVLVFHLDGVKPDLSKPDDKPSYWQSEWGLPQNFDWTLRPQWAQRWVSSQVEELKSIFHRFGLSKGVVPVDLQGYLPHYFRCFPYLGKFGDLDRVAQRRMIDQKRTPSSPEDEIQLAHWPKLEVSKGTKAIRETNLRGFLLEVILALCGRHVEWERSDHKPEFWLEDVPWQHPFSVAFSMTDVFKMILFCVERFGPKYIGVSHANDYKIVMGEELGVEDVDLKSLASGIVVKRSQFMKLCREARQSPPSPPDGRYAMTAKLSCRFCGWYEADGQKWKTSLRFLLDHLRKKHAETAICEICSKTYQSASHLETHQRNTHKNTYSESCQVCGKVITSGPRSMMLHMKMHAPKMIKCPQCPKMFRYKNNLKIHQKYHLAERPFSCEICDRGFARKQVWQRHILSHKEGKYTLS